MTIPFISAEELRESLPMTAAINAVARAFLDDDVVAPQRSRYPTTAGDLLMMPAWSPDWLGVKLVTVNPSNVAQGIPSIHGIYALFDVDGAPRVLIDAEELTRIRTAAVSAVATHLLARSDARSLVVFGAGTQADGHVEAMATVRTLESVSVVSRSQERARRLVERTSARLGIDVTVGRPDDIARADIVCTCTTSDTPVFPGTLLALGSHVNAVGSYRADARELDDDVMRRAALVVVEDRGVALAEAGDVVQATASGALDERKLEDLAEVLQRRPQRIPNAITVFKSVGKAMEDLTVARLVAEALKR